MTALLARVRAWRDARTTFAYCRCGCPRSVHEHYRPGTDCSACPCPRYRRSRA